MERASAGPRLPSELAGSEREAYYVSVSDGVKLAVSVYRPAGGGRFPTLLWLRPERRETFDPETGEIVPSMSPHEIAYFNARGYAIALGEMRGGGASFGTRDLDRSPQLGKDGADVVEWIARQPWSDGKLGMIGSSYQGFIQYATAARAPRGLKAIFPEIAGFDDYGSMFRPGGILNFDLSAFASTAMAMSAENRFDRDRKQFPAVPVVDEDGDGELADEIPLDLNGDGSFLDETRVAYADGNARQDLYLQATRAHLGNTQLTIERLAEAPYRDSRIAGTPYTFADIDPAARPKEIAEAGIAVYNRGGWFDYHARDTTLWYATLRGHTPTRLMMAPTGHGGLPAEQGEALYEAGPYFELFGDPTTNALMLEEKARFFDRYLRGIENGFERQDPVMLYVMGEGWRREAEWPIARTVRTQLDLAADGRMVSQPGAPGGDQYVVDFAASSLSDGANRWNYRISRSEKPMSLDGGTGSRARYASDVLAADTEVTGSAVVELVLSSDSDEADVFAYLEDVAPDGSSLLVTEGQLRANYYRTRPISGMLAPSARDFGVRPNLPWQGFDRSDYVAAPLAGDRRLRLTFDLMPTSWVFRRGHRIRLSLAGADSPSFVIHPGLEKLKETGGRPIWTIWRGDGLSSITLPIVPPRQ